MSIFRRLLAGGALALALLVLSLAAAPLAGAAGLTHSGGAYAVGLKGIKIVAGTVSLADTFLPEDVKLPSEGGKKERTQLDITLPAGLGSADVASAGVQGDHDQSNAHSTVTSVSILPVNGVTSGAVLEAELLKAKAAAACSGGVLVNSSIAKLNVLGHPIKVDVAPNTEIAVELGGEVAARVKINAQVSKVGAGSVWASASAVEVEFPEHGPLGALLQGTIILSHAEADMHGCPAVSPTPTATPTPAPTSGGGQPGFPATGAPSRPH